MEWMPTVNEDSTWPYNTPCGDLDPNSAVGLPIDSSVMKSPSTFVPMTWPMRRSLTIVDLASGR